VFDLMHFLSFPRKLLHLPVILPSYIAIFIENLRSEKAICKNHETFTTKQKQYYGILGLQEYFDNPEMHPLVRYTNMTVSWASMEFQRSTVARGTAYGKVS